MAINFEGLQGLAYPPNVAPEIEPWMERVRVTLERLLRTVTGGPQVIHLDLDVDDAGNVTAAITPNLSTEWIKYYVLTSGFPTVTQIDTLGTDIDITTANAGVTQNTGTIVTLTDGQAAYVGVLAYESDDGATGTGDVSTPMYSKITFGLDTDTTAFVPTVQADASVSGSTGTLLLTINDPGAFVSKVEFKKWEGVSWSAYVEDVAAPYTTTIAVQELHNVLIGWRVTYNTGAGNVFLEDTVTFDVDIIPELSALGLSVDQVTGNVFLDYSGDDDVGSVRYATDTSIYPVLATTQAGTVIAGRTTTGTQVYTAVPEGTTVFVSVLAYSDAVGGGIEGGQLYGVQTGRHVDSVVPTVEAIASVTGTTGTLTLTISDPSGVVSAVDFRKWEGTVWSSFANDPTPPYATTIAIQEKHNVMIGWRVTYDFGGANLFLQDHVTFDMDLLPELTSLDVSVNHVDGVTTVHYAGDDDVGSIRWATSTSALPSRATTQAGTVVAGRAGTFTPGVITEGQTRYVTVLAYTDAIGGGTEGSVLYDTQVTRHVDTDIQVPTVTVTPSVSGTTGTLTLVLNDPDSAVNLVGFRKWEGVSWGAWVDDSVPAFLLVATITLQEKHNVAIGWRVQYDLGTGDGNEMLGNTVEFDVDETPELASMLLSIDHTTGNVILDYNGDDDVGSIRYADSATAYPNLATTQAGAVVAGRSTSGTVVQAGISEGATRFVSVLAYTDGAGGGTESTELYTGQVTRHTDSTGTDTQIPSALADITAPGQITLTVQDDDGYLTGIGFQKFTNNAWGAWVDDTIVPYLAVATVTLEEKHTTAIGWRLLYNTGSGTRYVSGSVTFDPDLIPEIQNMGLDVAHTTGDVTLEWNGDDDVASIRWVDHATAYQSLVTTQAGNISNGRSGTVVVQSAIAEGASRFVTVLAYDTVGGVGIESNVLYRAKVTRHTDSDTPTDLPPIVTETMTESGGTGTLTLNVTDPQGSALTVRFYKRTGTNSSWDTVDTRSSVTSGTNVVDTVSLVATLSSFIRYEVDNVAGYTVGGVVQFDPDRIPNILSLGASVNDAGAVTASWVGDSDLASVRVSSSTSAYPSDATTRAATAFNGRVGTTTTLRTLTDGQTAWITAFGYFSTGGTGTESEIKAEIQVTYRTDSDTPNTDTNIPSALVDITGPGAIALTVQNDDGYLTGIGFKKYTGGAWAGSWTDDTSVPYGTTSSVTIEEKRNTAIAWRLIYNAGSGTRYTGGVVTFDADTTPELVSLTMDVTDAGATEVSIGVDDDCGGIRWSTSTSAYPTLATTQGGTIRSMAGIRQDTWSGGSISEAQTRYITILAYSNAIATLDEGPVLYKIKVTRSTDTTGTPLAELTSLDITGDINGNVLLSYAGNETVASVRWHDQATAYATPAAAKTAAAGGTLVATQSAQNIIVEPTIAKDASRYVAVVAYDNAGGTTGLSEVAYQGSWHRPFVNPEGELTDDIWINSNKNIKYGSVSGGAVPLVKRIYIPYNDFSVQAYTEGSTTNYTHGIGTVAYSWVAVTTGNIVLTAGLVLPEGSKLTSIIAYGERTNSSQSMNLLVARTGDTGVGTTLLSATSFPVATGSWGSRTFTFTEVISDPLSVRLSMTNSSATTGCKFGKLELVYEADNLSETI